MAGKNIELTQYGKLLALKVSHKVNRHTYWYCVCECGNTKNIRLDKLTTGLATSCGCDRQYNRKQKLTPNPISLGVLARIRCAILRYTGF